MWTGGTLGTGLSYHISSSQSSSVIFSSVFTLHFLLHWRKNRPDHSSSCSLLFWFKGSWLPSLLLGGTQVGWFGLAWRCLLFRWARQPGWILICDCRFRFTDDRHRLLWHFGAAVLSVIAVPAIACLGGYSVWWPLTAWAAWTH